MLCRSVLERWNEYQRKQLINQLPIAINFLNSASPLGRVLRFECATTSLCGFASAACGMSLMFTLFVVSLCNALLFFFFASIIAIINIISLLPSLCCQFVRGTGFMHCIFFLLTFCILIVVLIYTVIPWLFGNTTHSHRLWLNFITLNIWRRHKSHSHLVRWQC